MQWIVLYPFSLTCNFLNTTGLSRLSNLPKIKSRTVFQKKQREILEDHFQQSKYITKKERKTIADEINLTEQQVKTWFQNRRTRRRKANDNKDLYKGRSIEDYKKILAGKILSNFSGKLSLACVFQLHKQITES